MIVFRLCKQAYIYDLSGRGAEMNGGRWNSKGTAVIYTAASRALAVLEVAVHTPLGIMPLNYAMAVIDLKGTTKPAEISPDDLPANWNANPLVRATQRIGDNFIKENRHLVLRVPSATVTGDFNYLINPAHPDFKAVKILSVEPFEFNSRLFKK